MEKECWLFANSKYHWQSWWWSRCVFFSPQISSWMMESSCWTWTWTVSLQSWDSWRHSECSLLKIKVLRLLLFNCLKYLPQITFSSITRNIIQKNKHSHHRLGFDTYHPSSYTISVIGVQKFKYATFFWNMFHLLPTFYFQHHLQPPWKSRLGLWTFVRSENCSNWKYAKRWTGENNCNISRFYAIDC